MRNTYRKKSLLTISLVIAPIVSAIILVSCYDAPIYEITSQEILVLEEGSYKDVLINVRYGLRNISATKIFNSNPNINPLYATSPAPPNIVSLIANISIVSPDNFTANLPAGSELLSVFQIKLYPDNNTKTESFPIKLEEDGGIFLSLKAAPAMNILTKFEITTTLNDGRVFTSESEKLKIEL